jgi:hypothetical protein
MRARVLAVSLLLSACAASPQLVGPYPTRFSDADIQQIKLLISKNPDIDHRLARIEAVRSDKAWVKVGGPNRSGEGSRYTRFIVVKRAGKWIVDPHSPVEAEGIVIAH